MNIGDRVQLKASLRERLNIQGIGTVTEIRIIKASEHSHDPLPDYERVMVIYPDGAMTEGPDWHCQLARIP